MSEPSKIVPFPSSSNAGAPIKNVIRFFGGSHEYNFDLWEMLVGDSLQDVLDYLNVSPNDYQAYKANQRKVPDDILDLIENAINQAGFWQSHCLCSGNCGHDSKFDKVRNAFIFKKNLRKMTNTLGLSPADWLRGCVHENIFPSIQRYLETHKDELRPGSDPAFLVKPSDNEPIFFELYDMVIELTIPDRRERHAKRREERKEAYRKDKET